MTNHIITKTTTQNQTLVGRFAARLAAGRYRMVVRSLQMEAPDEFARIIARADPALDAGLASEVERLLRTGGAPFVRFDQTLMPKMIDRFGVTTEQLETLSHNELKVMQKSCNSCAETARCWNALRSGHNAEQCREFCPNSAAFEELLSSHSY